MREFGASPGCELSESESEVVIDSAVNLPEPMAARTLRGIASAPAAHEGAVPVAFVVATIAASGDARRSSRTACGRLTSQATATRTAKYAAASVTAAVAARA